MTKDNGSTLGELERRVALLEQQVRDLVARGADGHRPKGWRAAIGVFTGDELMREIFDEARKYREADRARARRRGAKRRGDAAGGRAKK